MPDGRSSMEYGLSSPKPDGVRVVDLDLHNMPPQADERSLKELTGGLHVVKTALTQDSVKGTLTGDGRVSIRLLQGQDYLDVKHKLQKAGISASLRKHVPARNSDFTQNSRDLKEQKKWATHTRQQSFPINKKTNTKAKKAAEMAGQIPRLDSAAGGHWK